MFLKLLMLFTMIPLVELYLLIKVGGEIGTLNTIAIVVLTGVIGASFARSQGSLVLSRIKETWSQGQIPGQDLMQGALILAGGIMLVTPGLLTDLLGLSLIFPLTREYYARWALSYFKKKFQSGNWQYTRYSYTTNDNPNYDKIDNGNNHDQ